MNDSSFLFDSIVFPEILSKLESNDSVRAYKRLKTEFEEFGGKPFLQLSSSDLISFGNHKKTYNAPSSVYLYVATIASMGHFTEKNAGELLTGTSYEHYRNPFFDAKRHFCYNFVIDEDKIPLAEDINNFIYHCNDMIKVISVLILKCGLTSTDICDLNITSINVDKNNNMYVHLKSNKERYVLVPSDLKIMLEEYMEHHGINPDGYIFQNARDKKLCVRTLERYYAKEAKRLDFNYTMKSLRTAAAVYMLAGKAQMNELCDTLGITSWSKFRYDRCRDNIDLFTTPQKSILNF